MSALVDVACKEYKHESARVVFREVRGARVEHLTLNCREVDFSRSGDCEYIAFHHLRNRDGETALEGAKRYRLLDLRNRFTFAPRGARISGWSRFEQTPQSFVAMSFDPAILLDGEGDRLKIANLRPLLYFRNRGLQQTFMKIERALVSPVAMDSLYFETLATLAVMETLLIAGMQGVNTAQSKGSRLTFAQVGLITDYIRANIQHAITLDELASLVGFSRYHFARSFSRTVGVPPHQYAMSIRVDNAKAMLRDRRLRIKDVARLTGFSSASGFSRVFVKFTSSTPNEYRRLVSQR